MLVVAISLVSVVCLLWLLWLHPVLQEAGDNNQFCWRNLFSCINLLRILNKLTKWKHSRTMVRAPHMNIFISNKSHLSQLTQSSRKQFSLMPLCSTRCWWCLNLLPSWRGRWRSSRPWCSCTFWNCSKCKLNILDVSGGKVTWRPCQPSTRKSDIASMTTGLMETVSGNPEQFTPVHNISQFVKQYSHQCYLYEPKFCYVTVQ